MKLFSIHPTKRELKENLEIQIRNNKYLRNCLQAEQRENIRLNKENRTLRREIEALKYNVRYAYAKTKKPRTRRTTKKEDK